MARGRHGGMIADRNPLSRTAARRAMSAYSDVEQCFGKVNLFERFFHVSIALTAVLILRYTDEAGVEDPQKRQLRMSKLVFLEQRFLKDADGVVGFAETLRLLSRVLQALFNALLDKIQESTDANGKVRHNVSCVPQSRP